jgi:hypothetical protein
VVITASRLAASSSETGGSAPGKGAFFLRGGWARPATASKQSSDASARIRNLRIEDRG